MHHHEIKNTISSLYNGEWRDFIEEDNNIITVFKLDDGTYSYYNFLTKEKITDFDEIIDKLKNIINKKEEREYIHLGGENTSWIIGKL